MDSLHRNKVKYSKLLLFHHWKTISLNKETVAVIKGEVNAIAVFIYILILTQNTSENKRLGDDLLLNLRLNLFLLFA